MNKEKELRKKAFPYIFFLLEIAQRWNTTQICKQEYASARHIELFLNLLPTDRQTYP